MGIWTLVFPVLDQNSDNYTIHIVDTQYESPIASHFLYLINQFYLFPSCTDAHRQKQNKTLFSITFSLKVQVFGIPKSQ